MKPPARLFIWHATHKELLNTDTEYRGRFHRYLINLMCLCALLLPFYLTFFGIPLFGYPANQCIIVGIAALIVVLALRQFHFQKQSIRRHLEIN